MIELAALSKRYGEVLAVDSVSLRVEARECLVLVGGSGSGKTTLLKLVNRLEEPSSGEVRIDGRDTRSWPGHELRRHIGYGFQQVGLFPHWSVAQNIAITPGLLGWPEERIRRRVDELLEMVELEPGAYRDRAPHELSGGQQQRVGLARALAAEPGVLLLDEPFGALDPLTRERLQDAFTRIRRELGTTSIFVTHDMSEALLLGDRVAVLEAGQLVQLASPRELLSHPATPVVAELVATPERQARAIEELRGASG